MVISHFLGNIHSFSIIVFGLKDLYQKFIFTEKNGNGKVFALNVLGNFKDNSPSDHDQDVQEQETTDQLKFLRQLSLLKQLSFLKLSLLRSLILILRLLALLAKQSTESEKSTRH